jgi:hypothetical protein
MEEFFLRLLASLVAFAVVDTVDYYLFSDALPWWFEAAIAVACCFGGLILIWWED